MKDRRTASSSLSSQVVEYLRQRGKTQAQIARMLHVSEGFVSLVKNRERCLTLDHLELLASSLSVPLGAMLLAVTMPAKQPKQDGRRRARIAWLMTKCDEAVAAILTNVKPTKRKSA